MGAVASQRPDNTHHAWCDSATGHHRLCGGQPPQPHPVRPLHRPDQQGKLHMDCREFTKMLTSTCHLRNQNFWEMKTYLTLLTPESSGQTARLSRKSGTKEDVGHAGHLEQ